MQTVQDFSRAPIGGVEQTVQKLRGYLLDRSHIIYVVNAIGQQLSIPPPEDVDIVHIFGTWTDYGIKIAEFYKGKVPVFVSPIYNNRALMLSEYGNWLTTQGRDQDRQFIEGYSNKLQGDVLKVCQTADYIAVLGELERAELLKLGVSEDAEFRVMTNGVDVELIQAVEQSWTIPVSSAILCPARYEYNKNQLRLIQAFAKFKEYAPAAQLWLAGAAFDVDYKRHCEEFSGPDVHWLGLRPTLELLHLMKAARIVALPSLSECVPLVILEAAALGKPAICTKHSYIEEYLPDYAQLCDPLDVHSIFTALRRAWLLLDNRITAAYVRQNLSWAKCAGSLLSYYAAALRGLLT